MERNVHLRRPAAPREATSYYSTPPLNEAHRGHPHLNVPLHPSSTQAVILGPGEPIIPASIGAQRHWCLSGEIYRPLVQG